MGLEQGISCEKFNKYTTNTPDITWKTPPKIQNNLRRSVMTCRNNRRVVFVVKRRRAKVDQSNLTVQEDATLASAT